MPFSSNENPSLNNFHSLCFLRSAFDIETYATIAYFSARVMDKDSSSVLTDSSHDPLLSTSSNHDDYDQERISRLQEKVFGNILVNLLQNHNFFLFDHLPLKKLIQLFQNADSQRNNPE